jgi:dinuclear metal center YbgI/SA1388 family protein
MATVKIKEIVCALEQLAPRPYQEEYDNSGLLTGHPEDEVRGVLVTLDCIEAVVDEAIGEKCNLIVAHHPILFKGLKKLTGQTYVERVIIKAVRANIAIYAIHTNLDNIQGGVNKMIAARLGLINTATLLPKKNTLSKLVTFIPTEQAEEVISRLHDAGAGQIGNYKNCSFRLTGEGTYLPTGDANPFQGEVGKLERAAETRVEVILPTHLESQVVAALKAAHPYEEVAYYLSRLVNDNQEVGSGIIGDLTMPAEPLSFLKELKIKMRTDCIRHTALITKKIEKVAVCGWAGSFLLPAAIARKADLFVSADFKYHEFFDSEGKIMIADIGHYESEQFTKELLYEFLKEKFSTFAIIFSKTVTNPISYL